MRSSQMGRSLRDSARAPFVRCAHREDWGAGGVEVRLRTLFWYRKLLRNPYTRTLRRMRTRAICRCVASALGARMSLATFFFMCKEQHLSFPNEVCLGSSGVPHMNTLRKRLINDKVKVRNITD